MKTIFAVIHNDISGDPLVSAFDNSLLSHFSHDRIKVEKINLSDLVGIGKMPTCLARWTDYDAVVIISNSSTAKYFLDVHSVIHNAKLWAINWPMKIANSGDTKKIRFFDFMPDISTEARELMSA